MPVLSSVDISPPNFTHFFFSYNSDILISGFRCDAVEVEEADSHSDSDSCLSPAIVPPLRDPPGLVGTSNATCGRQPSSTCATTSLRNRNSVAHVARSYRSGITDPAAHLPSFPLSSLLNANWFAQVAYRARKECSVHPVLKPSVFSKFRKHASTAPWVPALKKSISQSLVMQ